MSNIKIIGLSRTQLVNHAKEALEEFQGSPLRSSSKAITFLANMFRLRDENLLGMICEKNDSSTDSNILSVDLSDREEFCISNLKATFDYEHDTKKEILSSVLVEYEVYGFFGPSKIVISEGILDSNGFMVDPVPEYTGVKTGVERKDKVSSIERAKNLQAAITHATDLCEWLSKVKRDIAISDLEDDGWQISAVTSLGTVDNNPAKLMDFLARAKLGGMYSRNEIEVALLKLVGVDIHAGYAHEDIEDAVNKTQHIFGDKFNALKINQYREAL